MKLDEIRTCATALRTNKFKLIKVLILAMEDQTSFWSIGYKLMTVIRSIALVNHYGIQPNVTIIKFNPTHCKIRRKKDILNVKFKHIYLSAQFHKLTKIQYN